MKDNKLLIIGTSVAVGSAILWMLAGNDNNGKPFSPIVPFQRIRGNDPHGSGAFEASRRNRLHNGIDIVVQPGQPIKSPIDGTIKRHSFPYPDRSFSGYHLDTDKYLIKLWYLAPTLQAGAKVRAGQTLGFAQDLGTRYAGITPHVHMEVWDKSKVNTPVDPTNLFRT